jgi:hypothetical protein
MNSSNALNTSRLHIFDCHQKMAASISKLLLPHCSVELLPTGCGGILTMMFVVTIVLTMLFDHRPKFLALLYRKHLSAGVTSFIILRIHMMPTYTKHLY